MHEAVLLDAVCFRCVAEMSIEHVMDARLQVNITAENAKGDPLAQGTDYEAKPLSTSRSRSEK